MQLTIYFINTFTDKLFNGNPAAVCLLQKWLSEETLHKIAKEYNQPVTAFLVQQDHTYEIRWITPEYELELCGHGSLAAGFVIFNFIEPTSEIIKFQTRNEIVTVYRKQDLVSLSFPAKHIEPFSSKVLEDGLGIILTETYQHKTERCLAVYNTQEEILNIKPNMEILKNLTHRGITVTAPGDEVDFVSRTFYPHKLISEDAVTGASHCLLVPYWAQKLKKDFLHARQLSERGGELICENQEDRVMISGKSIMYMKGCLYL